jgi:hypothetical protein
MEQPHAADGGGGFDGTLVTGLGGASNQIPTSPTPLALGYVTLGSDSGHESAGGFDGRFALNARIVRQLRPASAQEDARRRDGAGAQEIRHAAETFLFYRRIAGRARSVDCRAVLPG